MERRFLIIALLVYWGKETVEAPSLVRTRGISKSDYDEQLQDFLKDLNKPDDPFKTENFQPAAKPTIIDKSSSNAFENAGDLESTISEIFGSKEFPKEGEKVHEDVHRVFENIPSLHGEIQSHNPLEEHINGHDDIKGSSGGPIFDQSGPKIEDIFKTPHTQGGKNIGNSNLGGPISENLSGPTRGYSFNGPNRGNDKEGIFKAPHGGLNSYNPNLGGPINEDLSGPSRGQLLNGPNRGNGMNFGMTYQGGPTFNAPHTLGGMNIYKPNIGGPMNGEFDGPRRGQLFNGPNRGNGMNFGMTYQGGPTFNAPHTLGGLNIHNPNLGGPINEEFRGPQREQSFNGPQTHGGINIHRPNLGGPIHKELDGPRREEGMNFGNPNLVGPGKEEIFDGPHRESGTNGGIFSLGGLIKDIFNGFQRPVEMGHENLPIKQDGFTMTDVIHDFAQRIKKMWHDVI